MGRSANVQRLDQAARACATAGHAVRYRDGWRTRGQGGLAPRVVVEHTTEDARPIPPDRMAALVANGHGAIAGNAIYNVLIDRNAVVRLIASGVAWHAGRGSWQGWSGNSRAWGIAYQRAQGQQLTPSQLEAGRTFTTALVAADPGLAVARVCEHHEWTTRKQDRLYRDGARMDGNAWRDSIQPATEPEETIVMAAKSRKVIHLGKRGGTAYWPEPDPDGNGWRLRPLPSPAVAEALTGEKRWASKSAVLPDAHIGRVKIL